MYGAPVLMFALLGLIYGLLVLMFNLLVLIEKGLF